MLRLVVLGCFLFVSTFLGVAEAEVVNYRSCDSTGSERNPRSEIHSVSVSPCAQAPEGPCEISTGTQNATITMDFTPTVKIGRRARHGFYWVQYVDVQLKGIPRSACRFVNCSLGANVRRTYEAVIPMRASFPKRVYDVKVKIYEGSKTIACAILPIKLV